MAFNPFPKTALRSVLLLLLVLGGCAGQEIRQPEESVKTDPELAAKFEKEGRTAFEEGRKGTAVKAWKKPWSWTRPTL